MGNRDGRAAAAPAAEISFAQSELAANPTLPDDKWSWWVGHQITEGTRTIPIIGEIPTRLDTYYLARMRKTKQGIEVVQTPCRAHYAPFAGVEVFFPARHTPDVRFNYREDRAQWVADTSVSWHDEDLDHDGQPGLSIQVDATICRGSLYVGSRTTLRSSAQWIDSRTWEGQVQMWHDFEVLGADRFCLRAFARNRREQGRGRFRFEALPGPTSCEFLLARAWPTQAPPPPSL